MISGDAGDGRESLVHASPVFLNGPKTGVDSGSLCVWQQCPVTPTTDIQVLREQILIKDCRKRAYSNGSSCIPVCIVLLYLVIILSKIINLQLQKVCKRGKEEQSPISAFF